MTGLADAYQHDVGALQSHTRLKAGVGLLGAGTLLCLLALVVAVANPTEWGARRLAGALVGLAAPALAGGVVVILPASPRLRAAAAIGASLTLLGVAAFWRAYPEHWMGHGRQLTPYVTGIYFLGMLTVALCLFAGIATFKRRNDPGGTVSLVVGKGETKVVEVESSGGGLGGLGGVGFLGGTPEGEVETQTNRSEPSGSASAGAATGSAGTTAGNSGGVATGSTGAASTAGSDDGAEVSTGGSFQSSDPLQEVGGGSATGGSSVSGVGGGSSGSSSPSARSSGPPEGRGALSDGGSGTDTLQTPEPNDDVTPGTSPDAADKYCGNCEHFSYARTDEGMTPYCARTAEYMEDVEACEDWSSNAGGR